MAPRRVMLGLAALASSGLAGCELPDFLQPQADAAVSPASQMASRALGTPACGDVRPDQLQVQGVFAFMYETVSSVNGLPRTNQEEVVTRYGLAAFCPGESTVDGALVVCELAQSPLWDEAEDCAAQLPSVAVLAALPAVTLRGEASGYGLEGRLSLRAFEERWGLAAGANAPAEPEGVELLESDGLVDQDDDGDPGVTLTGDGAVPTTAWAARLTSVALDLQLSGQVLTGSTSSETTEVIIGGPATRALRGRSRSGAEGSARFVRIDGLDGAPNLDTNGDGFYACGELLPYLTQLLPTPRLETACRR